MSKVPYESVNTTDSVNLGPKKYRNPDNDWTDYLKQKIEAGVWVAVFLFTFDRSQIVKQLFTNERVTRPFLIIFLTCLGINFSVTLFILYLNYAKGIRNYEEYSSAITPMSATAGFIGFLSFIVAIFPVYGFLSLVIVPVLAFGIMMFSAFIPFRGELNVFFLFLIMLLLVYVGYYWY